MDTIDKMILEGQIEPQTAMKIMSNFDKAIAKILADRVKARLSFKVRAHRVFALYTELILILLKGQLDTYRFCNEVWSFVIKDVTMTLDNHCHVKAEKIKIVSCNDKRPGQR